MSDSKTEVKVRRFIGIRPRVKKTAKGEARPTEVIIMTGDEVTKIELEDEQAELDFVLGHYPVGFRKLVDGEDTSAVLEHHLVRDKETTAVVKVPLDYVGFQAGDVVAMILGGSGDCMAYALSRRGEEMNAHVLRISPFNLKKERADETDEKADALLLAVLIQRKPHLFYKVYPRDQDLILMRERLRMRTDAMKARIACEQRLRQRFIGEVFCSKEGKFPEGSIEKMFDAKKATDRILKTLLAEEKSAERDLVKAVEKLDVWKEILSGVEGIGPMIAARLISSIQDIRRFETDAKLRAFCGVHVMADGTFARRRNGQVSNWHPDSRQALYLLGDQFNRRPDSTWGKYLLTCKARLQAIHPEVDASSGKKRYTKGHIHKMATWRAVSRFVRTLHRDWTRLERKRAEAESQSQAA